MDINSKATNMNAYCPPPSVSAARPRKKCHGNKKLQRFRKRRRTQGVSEAAINKMIETRTSEKDKKKGKKQETTNVPATIPCLETTAVMSIHTRSCSRYQINVFPLQKREEVDDGPGPVASTFKKRKRELSTQDLQHPLLSSVRIKRKKTLCIQSSTSNAISINKDYPFVFSPMK